MKPLGRVPNAAHFRARTRLASFTLLGMLSLPMAGCEKKTPPDPHLEQGFRLLTEDPKAAYDEFTQARDASHPDVLVGRGLALERLRQYEEAEQVLVEAHKLVPNQQPALFALSRVKIMLGKLDEARPLVEQLVALSPKELSAILLEVCLAKQESFARAALLHLETWQSYAREAKTPIPAEYYVARMSLAQQLKTPAAFEEAKALVPNAKLSDRQGALSLIQLALKSGRNDLAAYLLRKVGEVAFQAPEKLQVAQMAHGLGDHGLVEKLLGELPVVPGQERELLLLRAKHNFVTGKAGAEIPIQRALTGTKDEATRLQLQLMLVEALSRGGNKEQARKEIEQLESEHPKMSSALLVRLARLRIALEIDAKKPAEALRIAREAAGQAPKDVGLLLLLAEAERQANGVQAGIESLRRSVDQVPDDPRLRLAWAQALESNRQSKQALLVLQAAHAKLGDVPMIVAALALKLSQSGSAAEAAALYEKLLIEAKDNPVALNNLAMLYIDELGQIERGVELAEQAHRLSPAPAIIDTLGWALFKRGSGDDLKKARELLMSVSTQLSSPTFKYHLGAVLIASGETSQGKVLLQAALAAPEEFNGMDEARRLLMSQP